MPDSLYHINASAFTEARDFKSLVSVPRARLPQPDRERHGRQLLARIATVNRQVEEVERARRRLGLPEGVGMTVVVEVAPSGALDPATFEWKREGLEVLTVAAGAGSDIVAIHVPDGRLSAFEMRIRRYISENDPKTGRPRNAALVNAMADVRKAAFAELWTDEPDRLPVDDAPDWFQLWLRKGGISSEETFARFSVLAERLQITVEPGWVPFPGRIVVAVHANRARLQQAVELLDLVAEIRTVVPTAKFFVSDLKPFEQAPWISDLERRTTPSAPEHSPYVTLLDTGVAQAHPLLAQHLDVSDMHAVDANWTVADQEGHGSQMAGVTVYKDLTPLLAAQDAVAVPHRLESVKILPDQGQNAPHIYGAVMLRAARAVEDAAPQRSRVFAMMTTAGASTGAPTEWSATIDRLAFGAPLTEEAGEQPPAQHRPRLFVMSAGNIEWPEWINYPSWNDAKPAQDPAQSWNSLVVGAYTELVNLQSDQYTVLASSGAMAPMSTTTLTWRQNWPFKPDVVAEGGNGCLDGNNGVIVGPEELRILTTSHEPLNNPLLDCGGTSPAAAEVARACAHILARYPDYWPETVRALVVHGARYTDAMRASLPLNPVHQDKRNLLRRFGHGKLELERSLNSDNRRPTLVLQATIVPVIAEGGSIRMGRMNLHALPWPSAELEQLGHRLVEMRISLSYFVEPNPARRGWQSKFRYQSHGLRFAVRGSTESETEFLQRINKIEREALAAERQVEVGDLDRMSDPDLNGWLFGPTLRTRGSLHVDQWRGTAADLREKSHVAVFPVGGWWRDWKEQGRVDLPVRYALVVTLEIADEVDIDLYSSIAAKVQVPVAATVGAP